MEHVLKYKEKKKRVCIHEIIQLLIMKMKLKIDTTLIGLGLDMNTNIVNIKSLSI